MGRHLGIPTASVAPADAVEHFAHLGHFVALDSPATAAITRELLGWEPTGPSLLEDLEQDHYYRPGVAPRGARHRLVAPAPRLTTPTAHHLVWDAGPTGTRRTHR